MQLPTKTDEILTWQRHKVVDTHICCGIETLSTAPIVVSSGKGTGNTNQYTFSHLHLRHWPVAYLMTLSDWTMSCQAWPPRARYGQCARVKH